MKQRIISGAILVVLLIPTLLIGGYFTLAVFGIVSLIGMYELLKVFKLETKTIGLVGYACAILYYLALALYRANVLTKFTLSNLVLECCVLTFFALMICFVISYPKIRTKSITVVMFSFLYLPVMLSFIYRIRCLTGGVYLVWLIIISSWICDTCAYFSGVFLGKHKAFPVLSPKKTWEGCVGGVLGTVIISIIYAVIIRNKIDYISHPVLALSMVALFSSIISMFGDLAASAIKREYKIKDYSNLIPGHGGILDRFDSVIFVAPIVYFVILLFI